MSDSLSSADRDARIAAAGRAIAVETATVYRAAGRRYFRKASAVRALARALIRKHCYCEPGDHVTPGEVCHLHKYPHNDGDLQRPCDVILPRLTRFIALRLRSTAARSVSLSENG